MNDEVQAAAERYRQWIKGEIHECHETERQFREDAFTLANAYIALAEQLRGGVVVSREDAEQAANLFVLEARHARCNGATAAIIDSLNARAARIRDALRKS